VGNTDDNVIQLHPAPRLISPEDADCDVSDLIVRLYPDHDPRQTLGLVLRRPPDGFDGWKLSPDECDHLAVCAVRLAHTQRLRTELLEGPDG
jgi:hypothetical protein